MQMSRVVETCHLEGGLTVPRLGHLKCAACGARFFDDEAMHAIQGARSAATRGELAETRATKGAFKQILDKVPDRPPVEGDEV